jgi:hypothetical protein
MDFLFHFEFRPNLVVECAGNQKTETRVLKTGKISFVVKQISLELRINITWFLCN